MHVRRIAVSGGPGAGKTTLWRSLSDAYRERVIALPEVATQLFSHVFPPVRSAHERRAVQRAIFTVQHSLERVYEARLAHDQVLLCDRGTPDGGGYWPDGPEHFFSSMNTDWRDELARYDAVLFMESAAVGGMSILGEDNPTRTEDIATAARLDARLREVWQRHPRFVHVPHARDFVDKIARGRELAESLLGVLV